MDFYRFRSTVSKIEKLELPGEEIQLKMAPIERLRELKAQAAKMNTARKAGVLALFYPGEEDNTKLILILRKTYKGVHSAQIGFPGGKIEEGDKNLEETALRETEEEIGVPREQVRVLKQLTEMYIPPSNFIVQPFLGVIESKPVFVMQETEVEALVEVILEDLLSKDSIVTKKITTSYAVDIDVPAFHLNGHIVWGATAMILSEIRQLLKEVL